MAEQVAFSFDKASLVKILKGALIAGGAVALLYILQWAITVDFGAYTPLAVAVLSVLINAVKEFIAGKKQ